MMTSEKELEAKSTHFKKIYLDEMLKAEILNQAITEI